MSTIPYDDPITSLKDTNPDVLVLKTNVGNKQVPNVAWLAGYVDNKITGGGGALDSYLTKNEASTTYAAISNVYSKTDADSKFMLKTDTPNMNEYLPLTAGSNKALTGSLYTSAATPYLIGTAGKVGIRANRVDGSTYASQVALSYTNANLSDPYFINMVANANSENQTSLRLGVQDDGTYGLTYKKGDQIYKIYHEGNLDLSDITTAGAADIVYWDAETNPQLVEDLLGIFNTNSEVNYIRAATNEETSFFESIMSEIRGGRKISGIYIYNSLNISNSPLIAYLQLSLINNNTITFTVYNLEKSGVPTYGYIIEYNRGGIFITKTQLATKYDLGSYATSTSVQEIKSTVDKLKDRITSKSNVLVGYVSWYKIHLSSIFNSLNICFKSLSVSSSL